MKNQDKQTKRGILLAFLTSIISGVAIFYAKIAVAKIDPLVLTTSRNLYVGTIFLLWLLISKRLNEIKKLSTKQLIWLMLIGIIGGTLPFFLFFTGLKMVEPQTANLIQKTLFIWVSILAIIFLGERFNLIYFVSYLLIVLGNFYISPSLAVSFGKGEIMILVATLLWSLENIMAKNVLKSVSSELVGLFRMGIGSLILLSLALVSGKGRVFLNYNFQQLSTVFVGGIILFFYVYFWYKALKYAPASLVTLVLSFSLVVGNVLNGFFAGVKILLRDVYSTILICSAVLMIFFTQNVIPYLMRNLFNRFPLSRE